MISLRRLAVLAQLLLLVGASVVLAASGSEKGPQSVKDACPRLTEGALTEARLVALPSGVLLRCGNMEITQKDLDAEVGGFPSELRAQWKRNLFFLLEQKAALVFLDYEAKSWAKQNKNVARSADERLKAYISSLTANLTVSDDEARSFYDLNKSLVGGAPFDEVKDQLKDVLLTEKRRKALAEQVVSISARYLIDLNKSWVVKQYSAAMDNPVDKIRGSGKPTLVEFGAERCAPCRMMAPIIEELTKEYSGRLNVVFVNADKEQALTERYGVDLIPVQIFYDAQGKEIFRHVGFFPKDQIQAKLSQMGVK